MPEAGKASNLPAVSLFAEYGPAAQRRPVPPESLLLRSADAEDLPCLTRLSSDRHGGSQEDWRRSWEGTLKEAEDTTRALVLVADLAGETVAFGRAARFEACSGMPDRAAPDGWYLTGVIVNPAQRRHGIAHALTSVRLDRIAERAECAYYFASALNRPTIDLHDAFGFVEVTRDFWFPGVTFTGGVGILFRVEFKTST